MNNLYLKDKDIVLIRRASGNKEFEEYPLSVQPSSVLAVDPSNDIICYPMSSLLANATSASWALTSSYSTIAVTSSYAVTSSAAVIALGITRYPQLAGGGVRVLGHTDGDSTIYESSVLVDGSGFIYGNLSGSAQNAQTATSASAATHIPQIIPDSLGNGGTCLLLAAADNGTAMYLHISSSGAIQVTTWP